MASVTVSAAASLLFAISNYGSVKGYPNNFKNACKLSKDPTPGYDASNVGN